MRGREREGEREKEGGRESCARSRIVIISWNELGKQRSSAAALGTVIPLSDLRSI